MRVEVTRESELVRQVWTYTMDAHRSDGVIVHVDSYKRYTKESTRHRKWLVEKMFSRGAASDPDVTWRHFLDAEDVPMPADVVTEAAVKFNIAVREAVREAKPEARDKKR